MTDIDKLLAERATTHGDYTDHARCTQGVMRVVQREKNWSTLADDQRETLHMIAHKMGRIVTGTADVADHWDDIVGYAKLSADRVRARLQSGRRDTESEKMTEYIATTDQKHPVGGGVKFFTKSRKEHPAPFGYDEESE